MAQPILHTDRIDGSVQRFLAGEITAAGGREVSFVATVNDAGIVTAARAVARGWNSTLQSSCPTGDGALAGRRSAAFPKPLDRGHRIAHG